MKFIKENWKVIRVIGVITLAFATLIIIGNLIAIHLEGNFAQDIAWADWLGTVTSAGAMIFLWGQIKDQRKAMEIQKTQHDTEMKSQRYQIDLQEQQFQEQQEYNRSMAAFEMVQKYGDEAIKARGTEQEKDVLYHFIEVSVHLILHLRNVKIRNLHQDYFTLVMLGKESFMAESLYRNTDLMFNAMILFVEKKRIPAFEEYVQLYFKKLIDEKKQGYINTLKENAHDKTWFNLIL